MIYSLYTLDSTDDHFSRKISTSYTLFRQLHFRSPMVKILSWRKVAVKNLERTASGAFNVSKGV